MKDPTHVKGTPEWLKFNERRLVLAANTLTTLMSDAGLFPVAQERLRKAFYLATNSDDMRQAVNSEKRKQAAETDKYHQDHAAEYLNAVGVKLEELTAGERVQ